MSLDQRYKRNFGKGWFFDSWRHSLASRGIKTRRKYQATLKSLVNVDRAREMESRGLRTFHVHGGGEKDKFIVQEKPLYNAGKMRDIFKESDHLILTNAHGDVVREIRLDGDKVWIDPKGGSQPITVDADTDLFYEPWFMDQGSILFQAPDGLVGFKGQKIKLGVEFDDVKPASKKKFLLTKAWPYGVGQTRMKVKGKRMTLEPTAIEVTDIPSQFKSHHIPITEREVAAVLEGMSPEELRTAVRTVEIKSPSRWDFHSSQTYGVARAGGRFDIFKKPLVKTKKGDFYKIGSERIPAERFKEKLLQDVIPHEVGHLTLGHKDRNRSLPSTTAEAEASEFAKEYRRLRAIPEKYNKSSTFISKDLMDQLFGGK